MLIGILLFVWLICIAFLWNEGLWSNCLTLVNTLMSALVAMNYWEPVAEFLEQKLPTFTYLLDYLSLWLVFFLSVAVMRSATAFLSRTQVRFIPPIEQGGRIVTAILIGWIMVCFTLSSLHTAPLARTAIRGGFQETPMSNNFLGLAPDRMWLGYVQHRSKNALANSSPKVFDANADYIFKYGERRRKFSEMPTARTPKSP